MKHHRNHRILFDGRRILAFMLALALLAGSMAVYATDADDSGPVITGRRTCDDAVFVYIDGVKNAQDISVQIGNESCEDVTWSHGEFHRRTLLLLDNSLSMSQHWQKQSLSLMNMLIDDHAPGEEFMVATFSTEVTKLSSYSEDYDALKGLISGIRFANQKSYLTDVLYELLSEVTEDKESTFYRFVIIADGADDNTISYTEEELRDLIRKAGVPLYSVGVSTGGNAEPLQTMFSWSRLSGIEPVMADKKTDPATVAPALHADPLCVRIIPERSMQDGGSREAKITVDGVSLTTTLQLPFASDWDSPEEAEEEPEATPTPEEATPTPEEKKEPVKEEKEEEDGEDAILLPLVITGVSLILVLTVIVIVLAVRHRKKEDEPRFLTEEEQAPAAEPAPDDSAATELVRPSTAAGTSSTRDLWNNYITLTDSNDPSRSFRLAITDRILIGRKAPADLILDFDRAVSARHCMISRIDGRYFLRDLGSSNHTYYEGAMVTEEILLQNGGHIRIGHGDYVFEAQS